MTKLPKGSDALESLLSRFGESEDTFDVPLSDGTFLKFKTLPGYTDVRDLMTKAQAWAATMKQSGGVGDMRPLVKKADEEVLRKVYELSELSVEPKLSQVDVLLLSARAGMLFTQVYMQVLTRVDPSTRIAAREGVAEGKAASETASGETS
jgi:hypothetical protein